MRSFRTFGTLARSSAEERSAVAQKRGDGYGIRVLVDHFAVVFGNHRNTVAYRIHTIAFADAALSNPCSSASSRATRSETSQSRSVTPARTRFTRWSPICSIRTASFRRTTSWTPRVCQRSRCRTGMASFLQSRCGPRLPNLVGINRARPRSTQSRLTLHLAAFRA